MALLSKIDAQRRCAEASPDAYRIRAVWVFSGLSAIDEFNTARQPEPYSFALVLTGLGLGCCYADEILSVPHGWIGQDARTLEAPDPVWHVALLDSIPSPERRQPTKSVELTGAPAEKSAIRARVVADVVMEAAAAQGIKLPKIINIGAVGKFIAELTRRKCVVAACDLEDAIVGQEAGGTTVCGPETTERLISEADIALVTGMTVSNGTLDTILEHARNHGTAVIVFAETGGSFAPELLDAGICAVVAESFPFYVLPCSSFVNVYR
ncbi:MAG: hypothetical protein K8I30_08145 [Anaerolineae bacterium]|nr:hypothetical protein [Anaerolineae bacterium]